MKGREITTLAELRELDGKKITCTMDGTPVTDCLVSIQDGARSEDKDTIFLLQNAEDGADALDKKSYCYSWAANAETFYGLAYIHVAGTEAEENPEYTYGEVINAKPTPDWFSTEKPIFVYYSDQSEERAIADQDIKLCVGFNGTGTEPFLLSDGSGFSDYEEFHGAEVVPHNAAEDSTTTYTYAVPVKRSELKPKFVNTGSGSNGNSKGVINITKANGDTVEIKLTEEQVEQLL